MTVTSTTRTGQTKWSSGSDPLRRVQLNADADAVEAKMALDDGLTYTALPTMAEILRGRYAMFSSGAGAYTTLYRATADGGSWIPAAGNTMPDPVLHRPHAAGDHATTDVAETWTHPSLSNPGATVTYDGQARVTRLTAYDFDSAARGTVYAGLSPATAPDVATLGRVHVRTRQAAEKGLVVQAHDPTAGNLFTARESGGSDVVTVDANGYLRARALSGFGGGAVNAGAAVVAAPTSASGDGVDIGVLVHGQSVATAKTIMQVRRDLADTAPIINVNRDDISLGRLPWGSGSSGGTITTAARQAAVRALGYDVDTTLWKLSRASTSTPENPATDDLVASFGRTAGSIRVPLTLSQELSTGSAALTVRRYTDFSGRFLEFQRVTAGTEVISALEADGRMQLGARWISAGTMRDARQSLRHVCTKRWATPGVDGFTVGQQINPQSSFTYTFPVMTTRSASKFDLNLTINSEYTLAFETDDFGNSSLYNIYVSVNGGGFTLIETREFWGVAVQSTSRPVGVAPALVTTAGNYNPGDTIQVRVTVENNDQSIGARMYLRLLYLNLEEAITTAYSAA